MGELLRDAGADPNALNPAFDELPVPASLDYGLGLEPEAPGATAPPELPVGRLVVLAGPEVVRQRCIDGLRAFAAAANAPVANTWGAKGVFNWDNPHHMGTCALQARDFELLGFAGYDLIITTGLDPLESPRKLFELAPVLDVEPSLLGTLAEQVTPAPELETANDLYDRLAVVAQPGYVDERVPLHPARAVADLRAVLPADGIVVADPGPAGLWVARTFPTTEPGTVVVPATRASGIAAALALIAALRGKHPVVVTTEPLDRTTLALLELATDLAAHVVVDVWGGGGPVRAASDHVAHLRGAANEPGVAIVDVPVELARTADLVDAAGPVVAWDGLG